MNTEHIYQAVEQRLLREAHLYEAWQNFLGQKQNGRTYDLDETIALTKQSSDLHRLALLDTSSERALPEAWLLGYNALNRFLVCPKALDTYCSHLTFMPNKFVPPSLCVKTA